MCATPPLTAVAVATLTRSGGRAVLGIGAGGSGFAQMGIERRRGFTAIREAVEPIRHLLAGGEVDYAGDSIRFAHGSLEFETLRDVPVVIDVFAAQVMPRGRAAGIE